METTETKPFMFRQQFLLSVLSSFKIAFWSEIFGLGKQWKVMRELMQSYFDMSAFHLLRT